MTSSNDRSESPSGRPRERVALERAMDARRRFLRHSWEDVAREGGVKADTIRAARTGSAPIQQSTRAAIERGLQWQPGSVSAVLAGGDATPLEAIGPQVGPGQSGASGSQLWITPPGGGAPAMVPVVWSLIPGLEDATPEERAALTDEMIARMVHAGWSYLHEEGAKRLKSQKVK